MSSQEILARYKNGQITTEETMSLLRKLQAASKGVELSAGQMGLWTLYQLRPNSSSYNVPMCMRLRGSLDFDALESACRYVLDQHEALSYRFIVEKDIPRQCKQSSRLFKVGRTDISSVAADAVISFLSDKAKQAFSLESGWPLRIGVYSRSQQDHYLLIVVHHIVFDGSSVPLLMQSLWNAYSSFQAGNEPSTDPKPTAYREFVAWEREFLRGETAAIQGAYWQKQLAGHLPRLELPIDRPRTDKEPIGRTSRLVLDEQLVKKVRRVIGELRCSAAVAFLAAYKLLLQRYGGGEEVIVGMPTLGRPQRSFENAIGYFINMVALRSSIEVTQTFRQWVRNVELTMADAIDHAAYPFSRIVQDLKIPGSQRHSPVFQQLFVFQNKGVLSLHSEQTLRVGDLIVESTEGFNQEGGYELMFGVIEKENGYDLEFKYDANLFDLATIERMMQQYALLLDAIASDPDLELCRYSLLSPAEQARVTTDWNDTLTHFARDRCIHEIFEAQCARSPDALAVICEGKELTFEQLNRRANQLARHLCSLGAGPDIRIGICMERSVDAIVGLLGILKSGSAYVPLDPSYSPERLKFMLEDSSPSALVLNAATRGVLHCGAANVTIVDLDAESGRLAELESDNLPVRDLGVAANHLAYVIYTSGSTGKPKGVMVEHASVVNLWEALNRDIYASSSECRRVTLNASLSFDSSVKQFVQLLSGRTLCIVSHEVRLNPSSLVDYLVQNRVDCLDCTPAQLEGLIAVGWLKTQPHGIVLVGGEGIKSPMWRELAQSSKRAFNVYGPTECTVDSTWTAIAKVADTPHIGRPIQNVRVYVLDKQQMPVPVGAIGEMFIGGVGVARGYLNRSELTAERFVRDPFFGDGNERMYKTGDLARWRVDGTIEHLGRNDHQVKIRGFRVELGEIEARISSYPDVVSAVVLAREASDEKQLVGYVSSRSEIDLERLRAHLKETLPDYMVPAAIVRLEAFPLTHNGKVDRNALPAPDHSAYGMRRYEAPRGHLEQLLAKVWQDVLQIDRISRDDDFFELGGSSIMIPKILVALRKTGIHPTAAAFYGNPTVKGLAQWILRRAPSQSDSIVPLRVSSGARPLFAVHPLPGTVLCYFQLARQMAADTSVYGIQLATEQKAELSGISIEKLAARHLDAVREVQRTGPYRLMGYSAGGIIAYEMAAQLLACGETVEYLALIDSGFDMRLVYGDLSVEKIQSMSAIFLLVDALSDKASPTQLQTLAELENVELALDMAKRWGILPANFDSSDFDAIVGCSRELIPALHSYRPKPLPLDVNYFASTEALTDRSGAIGISDPERIPQQWADLLGTRLSLNRVGGNHITILEQPNLKKLADGLSSSLMNAEGANRRMEREEGCAA